MTSDGESGLSPLLIVVTSGVFTILFVGMWLVAKLIGDD
jgi:hypothetical protein